MVGTAFLADYREILSYWNYLILSGKSDLKMLHTGITVKKLIVYAPDKIFM
jgi:hypothetical protein